MDPIHPDGLRQDQVLLHVLSYQKILALAQETANVGGGNQTVWKELDEWVDKKISATKKSSATRK